MHSADMSQECKWNSSGSSPSSQESSSSLLNGQCEIRAWTADWLARGRGVAVLVAISTGSVGYIQLVVKFLELVAELGTVPQLYVASGVELVVMVGFIDPSTGVNAVVWPGGDMQMYFPTIAGKFRQSWPIEGFQLRNMISSTPFPLNPTSDVQVSLATTSLTRHLETLSRQSVSPPVKDSFKDSGRLFQRRRRSVETERLFEICFMVSPDFAMYFWVQVGLL